MPFGYNAMVAANQNRTMRIQRHLTSILSIGAIVSSAIAQGPCEPNLIANGPRNGADGSVRASVRWDPDGAGPMPELLVVAGEFGAIGDQRTSVAALDEASGAWTSLGTASGASGRIFSLAVDSLGALLVGGDFNSIGQLVSPALARFDGTSWQSLGQVQPASLSPRTVNDIAVMPNGDVVIGGLFIGVGGVIASSLARYDGTSWQAFGNPSVPWQIGTLRDLQVMPGGDLIVAGWFTTIGGISCNGVARWNGSAWSAVGPFGPEFVQVDKLAVDVNLNIYCTGFLSGLIGLGTERAAQWDGTSWSAMTGLTGIPGAIFIDSSGDLLVGSGVPSSGGFATSRVRRWTGSAWQALPGTFKGGVFHLTELANGELLAGGSSQSVDVGTAQAPVAIGGLARFDGASWQPLSPGTAGTVRDVVALPGRTHVAVGDLRQIGNQPSGAIVRPTNTGWTSQGITAPTEDVRRIVARLDGSFALATRSATSPNRSIWLWFGGTGSQLVGLTSVDPELAIAPNGDLLVAGSRVFDGAQNATSSVLSRRNVATGIWSNVDWGLVGQITAMAVQPDGAIVIGGSDLESNGQPLGRLARWNGTSWDTLQSGLDQTPSAILALPDNRLVVVGKFTIAGGLPANGIARFDGVSWSTFGAGFALQPWLEGPLTIASLPAGELLVGGEFELVDGVAASNLARWDGSNWNAIGSGANGAVRRISVAVDGGIAMCGDFTTVDGESTAYLVDLFPSCAAQIMSMGGGCQHLMSGAVPTLVVEQLPMRGGELRTATANLPTSSLAIAVVGLSPVYFTLPQLNLPSNASCALRVQPDIVALLVPNLGRVTFALDLPNDPSIVGAQLLHQTVSLDFTAGGMLRSAATSIGLQMIIGSVW